MNNQPIHVSNDNFQSAVLEANELVVVDFWAEWCAPCKQVNQWMHHIALTYADSLLVAKVDADQNPELIANYSIRGLPTILFFYEGELLHRHVDKINEEGLIQLVDRFLGE